MPKEICDPFEMHVAADLVVADLVCRESYLPVLTAIKEYRDFYESAHGWRPTLLEAKNMISAARDRAGL